MLVEFESDVKIEKESFWGALRPIFAQNLSVAPE